MSDAKETNKGHEEKEPQEKGELKGSCGCGCVPLIEAK